jgi:8-oxo-dGTP diphosphatase
MNAGTSSLPGSTPARKLVEVAIAIVFNRSSGELLICRRKADVVLGGYWEFPGGKCDPGESPSQCACREVEEETGLTVRVLQALPVIEHEYPHARVRLNPFICEHIAGEVELRDIADARWIPPERVHDYRFPEANGSLLEQVSRGLVALPA